MLQSKISGELDCSRDAVMAPRPAPFFFPFSKLNAVSFFFAPHAQHPHDLFPTLIQMYIDPLRQRGPKNLCFAIYVYIR